MLTKSGKALKFHTDLLGLSDPWRIKFPSTKVFSFFLHVHRTYSHIDHFLLDNKLLHNITSQNYQSVVISDHAPTSLIFHRADRSLSQENLDLTYFPNPHLKTFSICILKCSLKWMTLQTSVVMYSGSLSRLISVGRLSLLFLTLENQSNLNWPELQPKYKTWMPQLTPPPLFIPLGCNYNLNMICYWLVMLRGSFFKPDSVILNMVTEQAKCSHIRYHIRHLAPRD